MKEKKHGTVETRLERVPKILTSITGKLWRKFLYYWLYNLWVLWVKRRFCKSRSTKYFLITDRIGDHLLALMFLRKLEELEPGIRIIIHEPYKELVKYFPEISDKILCWPDEKFFFARTSEIGRAGGIIGYLKRLDLLVGVPEITKCGNLYVVGNKYNHMRRFIKEMNRSKRRRRFDEFFKSVLGLCDSASIAVERGRIRRHREEAIDFLKAHDYVPGKSVILSPYSSTHAEFSNTSLVFSAFEKIARELSEKGYKVFTNVSKADPKPLKGTVPLSPPLHLVVDVAELCGYVVTFRSGFADLAACSNAKLFVYYPNLKIYKVSTLEYFSLRAIFENENVIEFSGDISDFCRMVVRAFEN